ncbi:TrmH family RNA methyltransferase [Micromonospora sp. CPCC 206061]|uniref:TrmH family RNA methyltransferase n=1 Tax=Micromonospora sp. CPCC 206061 TaxID=3122410 RepID=UPI002FEF1E55
MVKTLRITTRNATFQQWLAMLSNRNKRQRASEFIVQGVRPISLAVEHGWHVRALLFAEEQALSHWAHAILNRASTAVRVTLAPDLLHELGGKDEESPELLAVVGLPEDDLSRIPVSPDMLILVFDRPATPGNIGTLIRSADALGASGVVITGHAADPYDPKAVRASTGSLFAVPVVRVASHRDLLDWATAIRARGTALEILGTDEHGTHDIAEHDLTGAKIIVIGNETQGLSAAWRDACEQTLRIPIGGSASSLNAAAAGTIVLYEAARQRARGR